MKILKFLLFPFALLYGFIVFMRNKLYDWHLLKSTSFGISTISVGNLSVGGTGKTPHIEYLIRLLKTDNIIATLSRGYGRKTKGFISADNDSTSEIIGDEPLQFKTKFPDITVAVDEKRVNGINQLLSIIPELQGVLLDDAFQHRAVTPGLSIVLTDYSHPYFNDFMLPAGTLREFRMGIKRADTIIITKCPEHLTEQERTLIRNKVNPLSHQQVYFTFIKYGNLLPLDNKNNTFAPEKILDKTCSVILFAGIANTLPLQKYLSERVETVVNIKFSDHHQFTIEELEEIKKAFNELKSTNKVIITTEKDAMRLQAPSLMEALKNLPVYYIPIEIDFNQTDKTSFDHQILNYVRASKNNGSIH